MSKILVPTDFSKNAELALNYAVQIALKKGEKIDILHTYEQPESGSGFMINIVDILKEDAEKSMEKLVAQFSLSHPTIQFNSRIEYGDLVKTISNYKNEYDLLVMGTKGASGVKEIFIGSNAANIINNCSIPTLIIPQNCSEVSTSSMTIALDMKPLSDKVFDRIKFFNQDLNLDIDFVTVNEKVKEQQPHFILPFVNATINFMKNDNIELGLSNYMKDKNDSILTIINRKRTFFQSLFHKSISRSIALHFNSPMLILQD